MQKEHSDDRIYIYTKPECKYCTLAKALFGPFDHQVTYIEYAGETDIKEWMQSHNHTTFPVIVMFGTFIGGYDSALEVMNCITHPLKKKLVHIIDCQSDF